MTNITSALPFLLLLPTVILGYWGLWKLFLLGVWILNSGWNDKNFKS